MRVDALRFKGAARATLCAATLCAAALALGALGCARGIGGEAQPQAFLPGSTPAQTATPAPSPAVKSTLPASEGFVNDFANVIDEQTEELLEAKFVRLKESARIEFAVATVETTGEDDILDYSLALARRWGVGPPAGEGGGGLLLLLAIKDRKWRLQVSRSLEADLPDDVTAELGKVMTPSLRAGSYGAAVTQYADSLIKRLAERRGFSMQGGELNLQTSPEAKPKATPPRKP